jgi:hypothetical protein
MKQVFLLFALMLFWCGYEKCAAQDPKSKSLQEALNADGTIKSGMQGSFNAQGFKMGYAANGAPKFAAADSGYWEGIGGQRQGLYGSVLAIAISGKDIFIGGAFVVNANHIVKWDGASWQALGTGLNNIVRTIAISGTDVYVGGQFTNAGGDTNANYIAKWNGMNWQALGKGLNNTVRAISISDTDVYVGGAFIDAGGNANADYIARWDGANWQALGIGLNNSAGVST